VMHAHPLVFKALQGFGAAYLGWLGIQLLRSPVANVASTPAQKKSGWRYFQQAFRVSLTNPKVILFFLAFFPLFLHAHASSITLGVMMAHVTLISFLYQAGLVLVGNALACKLSPLPSVRKIAARLAGVALIGFGVKLAANNR
jgi:leucine efflux protein